MFSLFVRSAGITMVVIASTVSSTAHVRVYVMAHGWPPDVTCVTVLTGKWDARLQR